MTKIILIIFVVFAAVTGRSDPPDAARGSTEKVVTTPDGVVHLPPFRFDLLPPYLVTASRSRSIVWRYVAIPGFEILSCCEDTLTNRFVRQIYQSQDTLNMLAPPDLQRRQSVPTTLILFSDDVQRIMSKDIVAVAQANAERLKKANAQEGMQFSWHVPDSVPQIKLWDSDSTGIDVILSDLDADEYSNYVRFRRTALKPEYFLFRLGTRVPPLPPWFIVGEVSFYQSLPSPRIIWISPEITDPFRAILNGSSKDMKSHLPFLRIALPMRRFLVEPPPPGRTPKEKESWFARASLGMPSGEVPGTVLSDHRAEYIGRHGADPDSPWCSDIWRSQAALFIQWAFDDKTFLRREALWKFAALASSAPATETMFRECFGFGFEATDLQLNEYLRARIKKGDELFFTLRGPEGLAQMAQFNRMPLDIRDPTAAEKARILGDWERKEIEFVDKADPEFSDLYAQQARVTLMDAYEQGERDPGLQAALGIYECSVNDDLRARGFLEAAVQAGVVRPRAYVELARIRLTAALASPDGADGRLDARQAASVLELLRTVRSQEPPQLAGYLLFAQVWEHSLPAPTGADLSVLDEGCHFFPFDRNLIAATARLHGSAGLAR